MPGDHVTQAGAGLEQHGRACKLALVKMNTLGDPMTWFNSTCAILDILE